MSKLDPRAFGLACGILWAGGLVFMGLTAAVCPWARPFVHATGVIYLGYKAGLVGSIIGGAWGFLDALIGGLIFAWLYNKLLKP